MFDGGTTDRTSQPVLGREQEPDDSYTQQVEDARTRKLPRILVNTSSEHAKIIIKNLFIFAKEENKEVKLLSGILNDLTYTPLVPYVQQVLEAGVRVRVIAIAGREKLEQNRFFSVVTQHVNGSTCALNQTISSISHFCLVGDTAYRLELNDQTKEAYACFNDADKLTTSMLDKTFEEKWKECTRGEDNNGDGRAVGAH
jgi:hypothetical protein